MLSSGVESVSWSECFHISNTRQQCDDLNLSEAYRVTNTLPHVQEASRVPSHQTEYHLLSFFLL
ncbi:hypothetical protein HanXRQr2_Chr04g0178941 [Helianthus annuus]|uniref:Uncharacterized protein n=1 Tax=Helianthus annuus TaxID=4232 RepID=A0A9K3NST5_HELAN|nr:hypothetical protein HanXRQr2_Chr04g0178941 [Helianthus annuus]